MAEDRHAREAVVVSYNRFTGKVTFKLTESQPFDVEHEAAVPFAWTGPNGEFSGGYPETGATIWVSQGPGGRWTVIGWNAAQGSHRDVTRISASEPRQNLMTWLRPGRYVTQVRNSDGRGFSAFMADPDTGLWTGNNNEYINVNSFDKIRTDKFTQTVDLTECCHRVTGPVFRDVDKVIDLDTLTPSLDTPLEGLKTVGLDPRASGLGVRNPTLTEQREIVYEYTLGFQVGNTIEIERSIQSGEVQADTATHQRQDVRTDTLSLSLNAQNYLIERTVGTIVDVSGNVLNLNRDILPSGQLNTLSFRKAENRETAYNGLIEQQRKSIAYHFELNARKPDTPDVKIHEDYARDRSRFFVDIDKEGQFKINVPMSSETGNVGLLTRYENYSVLKAADDGSDSTNSFVRNVDNRDVFHEEFGRGAVSLSSNSEELQAFTSPNDRFTNTKVKLGTGFHLIRDTVELHQRVQPIAQAYPDSRLNQLTPVSNVVNPEVIVSGEGANAGGRSGTISLDGSLAMSIGANTVDRQSLWLDCAGGVVSHLGRDRQGISYAATYDGDVLIQIGGATVSNDSRFDDGTNSVRDGVLDIRIVQNAMMSIIRVDPNMGMAVYTPGDIDFFSEGNIRIKATADLILDGESVYIYTEKDTGAVMRYVERSKNGDTAKSIR